MEVPSDVLIMIPTKRRPPLRTLEVFKPTSRVVILADPEVAVEHGQFYSAEKYPNYEVFTGVPGLTAQGMRLYSLCHELGFAWFFRMDDDLTPNYFVDYIGDHPSLEKCIQLARQCADETKTTLVGFANTSREDWLGFPGEFRRSSGLIHGGACLVKSRPDPEAVMNPALRRYDDVYRTAAHRRLDGAVGRVQWIGLDKRESLRDTSCDTSEEAVTSSVALLLKEFPNMVSCKGTRTLDGGRQTIPNLRLIGRARPL